MVERTRFAEPFAAANCKLTMVLKCLEVTRAEIEDACAWMHGWMDAWMDG